MKKKQSFNLVALGLLMALSLWGELSHGGRGYDHVQTPLAGSQGIRRPQIERITAEEKKTLRIQGLKEKIEKRQEALHKLEIKKEKLVETADFQDKRDQMMEKLREIINNSK